MDIEQEYRLQMYQDLGPLGMQEEIRLKRNKIYGNICVEKRVSSELKHIYDFLKENNTRGVPQIQECILEEDSLIIIEEYVAGRTLEAIVREAPLGEEEVVRIILQLCDILDVLHNATPSIICRDIKAENIMIDLEGCVWLVDFNIARTFQEGKKRDTVILGTAEYAAPEQFGFFQTDNRTDIYALGVLINYMMTRKFPVEEMVKGRLFQIVQKCTYLEPGKRYQDIEKVKEELFQLYPSYRKQKERNTDKKSFVPPGFRSNTFWKKIVAVIGYLFCVWFSFSMEIKSENVVLSGWLLRVEQGIIFVSQMLFVGVVCNYRGWRDQIPLFNKKSRYVRIVLYFLTELVLLFAAAIACGICDIIF